MVNAQNMTKNVSKAINRVGYNKNNNKNKKREERKAFIINIHNINEIFCTFEQKIIDFICRSAQNATSTGK